MLKRWKHYEKNAITWNSKIL